MKHITCVSLGKLNLQFSWVRSWVLSACDLRESSIPHVCPWENLSFSLHESDHEYCISEIYHMCISEEILWSLAGIYKMLTVIVCISSRRPGCQTSSATKSAATSSTWSPFSSTTYMFEFSYRSSLAFMHIQELCDKRLPYDWLNHPKRLEMWATNLCN